MCNFFMRGLTSLYKHEDRHFYYDVFNVYTLKVKRYSVNTTFCHLMVLTKIVFFFTVSKATNA